MKCPICTSKDLVLSERQGIEIDYCPECRGIWLDQGELEKIIERSDSKVSPSHPITPQNYEHDPHILKGKSDQHDEHGRHNFGYNRRKSWLGELFD